jgi:hypothetical protein
MRVAMKRVGNTTDSLAINNNGRKREKRKHHPKPKNEILVVLPQTESLSDIKRDLIIPKVREEKCER